MSLDELPLDLSFVCRDLHDVSGPLGTWAQHVRGVPTGLVGNSLGGLAAVGAARIDPSFTAIVGLALILTNLAIQLWTADERSVTTSYAGLGVQLFGIALPYTRLAGLAVALIVVVGLHLFLQRKYRDVDVVFIRHTDDAEEVDEETFFHGQKSGGTKVLSALQLMDRIVRERYGGAGWNVYGAQASDGDALGSDPGESASFLQQSVLNAFRFGVGANREDQRIGAFGPCGIRHF